MGGGAHSPEGDRRRPSPASRRGVDRAAPLLGLVATCLAKRSEERFASTRELAAALDALRTGESAASEASTEVRSAPELQATRRRSLRRPALVLGAALALALAVALAVAGGLRFRASRGALDSLAVLPFENASQDPEADYLGDGLTESLIEQMSKVPSLKVMARATVFRFKGQGDPLEAGRSLGVGAVLTGTVSRRGERLSISVELVEVATGARLWGETYDRPVGELLRVQDSIASDVADRLRPRLSSEEKRTLDRHGTANAEAYELYLKARFFLLRETEEDDLEARRLYLQAVEKDPRFVEAHVGVSMTYGRSATV